ncbi:MAG: response regulator [Spirochaetaceae bacterium]|nr:response regulator [Spirochaetaceae bacterium]
MHLSAGPTELDAGLFWVGSHILNERLQTNIYLLKTGGTAVLFGPGSVLMVPEVVDNVERIASSSAVTLAVIQQPDPCLVSGIALFERAGYRFRIATASALWGALRAFGALSSPLFVDDLGWKLDAGQGNVLECVPMPYVTSPYAFAVYDPRSGTLFSGDLFSTFSREVMLHSSPELPAEAMRRYHALMVPSGAALTAALEHLKTRKIRRICPAHGPVIPDSQVAAAFNALEGLTCGELLSDMAQEGRIAAHSEKLRLIGPGFRSRPHASDEEHAEINRLLGEIERLRRINEQLNRTIEISRNRSIRDSLTGLYEEEFFKSLVEEEAALSAQDREGKMYALGVIGIDNDLAMLESRYGSDEVDQVLRGVASVINRHMPAKGLASRLHGAMMGAWAGFASLEEAVAMFDRIRYDVSNSKSFVEPITISVGMATVGELIPAHADLTRLATALIDLAIQRMRLARTRGGNNICSMTSVPSLEQRGGRGRILLIDDDETNRGILAVLLGNEEYEILQASDGYQALEKTEQESVDVIVTELMLPKMDAFRLKELLKAASSTKDIPVIVISHLKNETSVRRAYGLGISHYLQKPILPEELLGIIRNLIPARGG